MFCFLIGFSLAQFDSKPKSIARNISDMVMDGINDSNLCQISHIKQSLCARCCMIVSIELLCYSHRSNCLFNRSILSSTCVSSLLFFPLRQWHIYTIAAPVNLKPLQRFNDIQSRQTVDDNIPVNGLDVSRWKTLGISAYLQSWTTYHMPKCTGTLHSDYAWCFQDYINGSVSNQNCSIDALSGCAIPSDLNAQGQTISETDLSILWIVFVCILSTHKKKCQADEAIENSPVLRHCLVCHCGRRPNSFRLRWYSSTNIQPACGEECRPRRLPPGAVDRLLIHPCTCGIATRQGRP